MKKLICLLALFGSVAGISDVSAATESDENISAVIELQDADIASLKQTGFFKMAIPPSYRERISSVTLKRPIRFKDESAVSYNDVDRRSGTIAISVDDSTLEQIDYQPVELKIYESGFSNIIVRYQPGNSTPASKPSKKDSGVFITTLSNSKSITGRLAGMKEFSIKSGLGKVDVDLEEVSEISFDEDGKATVQMSSGDQLSGEINFKNITINSRWGAEDLKIADITRISKPFNAAANMMAMPSAFMPAASTPMAPMNNQAMPMPNGSVPTGMQSVYSANEPPMPTEPMPMNSLPMPMASGPMPTNMLPMEMPVNASPLQSFSYPTENTYYLNGNRIDAVPGPPNQATNSMQGYSDPYAEPQYFDQSYQQLMQPVDPSMGEIQVGESLGPFFDGQMIQPQPTGGYGEMIQDQQFNQGSQEQYIPQSSSPTNDDFWLFPQQ